MNISRRKWIASKNKEVRDRSDRFNSFKGDEERQRQQEQFDRFMGRPQQD